LELPPRMKSPIRPPLPRGLMVLVGTACLLATTASGQTATCEPIEQRNGREFGCFITARQDLGALPRDSALYWHIDAFPSEAKATTARSARGTVVHSLGRIWLFTIGDSAWRASGGEQIAVVGPLPLVEADSFTAVYMEGVFRPGMQSPVHRHPGVEAWYTLEGEQCLETPQGKLEQRAGGPGVMVPGGVPMILTGTGTGVRRSLVLILQATGQPRSVVAADWKPAGLCRRHDPPAE
jgi:quercetin dioxygenase-like cupin family protein